jgi:hypothetical protein
MVNLNAEIKFQNFIVESIDTGVDVRPFKDPEIIRTLYQQKTTLLNQGLSTSLAKGLDI